MRVYQLTPSTLYCTCCHPLILHSFGVVCYEVSTQLHPYGDLSSTQITFAVAQGRRPEFSSRRPSKEMISLMTTCWHLDQARRPDGFEPLTEALEDLQSKLGGDPREPTTRYTHKQPGSQRPPHVRLPQSTYTDSTRILSNWTGNTSATSLESESGELFCLCVAGHSPFVHDGFEGVIYSLFCSVVSHTPAMPQGYRW